MDDLEPYQDEQDPTVTAGWAIQNQNSADWALGRLADCEREIASIDSQYEAAVARLVARKAELNGRAQRGATYFRAKLEEWATRNRAVLTHGQKKSAALLHGHIGWRKKGGGLKVEDKAALIEWLSVQPVEWGLYRVKVEPEMEALQSRFKQLGEVPPGCIDVPETDVFYAKPIVSTEGSIMKGE